MKLTSVFVDDQGQSYFGEVESDDPKGRERQQDIAYWQVWETKPGHFADFAPVDAPKCIAMMSGKVEVVVSNGQRRFFSRGDTFLLQDTKGKGHAIRTIGAENMSAMLITMKEMMTETAKA
jgi:uncharacterized cupin superfamily protein